MENILKISLVFSLFFGTTMVLFSQDHPCLMFTPKSVENIRAQLGQAPLFGIQLAKTIKEVDAEIEEGIFVPIPKDMSGGYTHERHKKNFFILQKAGNLFQLTGEEKYAVYIRDMLLEYAKMYPTLELHPTNRSYATGKIFWQCLNDANWLVYVSQAYDCIYDWLTEADRNHLEKDLFRPFADFLSVGNPKFFNRIHNHSTWANAAVGMIALVMQDEELINRALYGLKDDGIAEGELDNDGGFIKQEGQRQAGFLAQLDFSFSPDGHFTEGPYYLRYAMSPFLLFAKSLANNRPDLDIMAYRDNILKKSVYALLNEADATGVFFPINDAQKGMSWLAREVVAAIDIAYLHFGRDPYLLSIANLQGEVLLDETGFAVAEDLAKGLAKPFRQQSIEYRDGADGQQGGIGIIRTSADNNDELCLVMKYAAHGMGHGHFDRLSYSLYDDTGEVVQDYGAARWVNIDQKGGGRYLPENQSWAKQSIAHNTVVINETSQYEGEVKKAESNHSERYMFSSQNDNIKAVSAKEFHAYPSTEMHRTMVLVEDKKLQKPIVLDVFRVKSEEPKQYDLPTWFLGHLLSTNFDYKTQTETLSTLGRDHGYQHVWMEAKGKSKDENAKLTWFANGKFFSMTTLVTAEDELIFARTGANDPSFNLRHDPAFIIRKKGAEEALFVSVIEPHGNYNPVAEIPHSPFSSIDKLRLLHDDDRYTIINFSNKSGTTWTIMIANQNAAEKAVHELKVDEVVYDWVGPIKMKVAEK